MKKIICYTTLMACLLIGCAKKPQDPGPAVVGNLSYRAPVKLDGHAIVELRLTDVSISDGPALEVAKVVIDDAKALPYQYSLPYDPKLIDAHHRYTVDARISIDGQVRFATDAAYEVLTQGNGAQRDIAVVAAGGNETSIASEPPATSDLQTYRNEIRTAQGVSLYRAAFKANELVALEEDRSNGTPQPLHARYEFKGAWLTRYRDSSPVEINFDERGRPTTITKQQQSLKVSEQTSLINAVRNQAALLRSHALAASEASAHRKATGG